MVLISTNGTQPQEKIRLANMFNVGPLFNFLTPLILLSGLCNLPLHLVQVFL